MTITTTAPTISATGISAPSYEDILAFLQSQYQSIYGADIYLGSDSQDGQFLGILASAISDANAVAIQIYNSFSPATATGTALSSNVKINGIAREVASYSTVDLTITGQAGTTITHGIATDIAKNLWSLPASVTIPSSGSITVTAICQALGAVQAASGTVTTIATPTLGWQSVTNPTEAAPGAPVEDDAALRQRQTVSTALPSQTVMDGIIGAISALANVTRYAAFENPTGTTDANGIPAHSISMVVEGGDVAAIAEQIALKKTPGTGTFGTTAQSVLDAYGNAITINFYRPTDVPITVSIGLTGLSGYSGTVGDEITAAVVDYINALSIGSKVMLSRLYVPANLGGSTDSATYEITSLEISRDGAAVAPSDVAIAFNEVATCTSSLVTLTVS
ncbi:hypothetical protein CS053_08475 [Rhodanobacter glycinis]|uniref:Baseplate protein J-like barrel domain-containing protein n=1 Tax=Rhodanobacter glycinis TaxID=582702 RepID=A0A5B9DWY7_9GAMM|nr:baseplate J/gp47 family protein [Rhodanobacter glycinis]QEE24533.1 hypothetical protein CS053_08475 [Rhodanobacter glycinis]